MRNLVVPFFVAALGLGLWINERSWNGQSFVFSGQERRVAAVRALGDYSVEYKSLYRSAQAQLLNHAEVFNEDGRYGVKLGLPVVARQSLVSKDFACPAGDHQGIYDRIELTFMAVGVSESGESPKMIVDTPCAGEKDFSRIETVWIPIKEITSKPSRDMFFDLAANQFMHVHFSPLPSAWPSQWVLWSVKLYNRELPDEALMVSTESLRNARPKLLSLGGE